ncbi:MAG: VWA domain-containing protein [Candidatus Brocadiaceae bacterium]|nr:VWA domain-containing protein [Candidatus Brocadiaceae bacterium]
MQFETPRLLLLLLPVAALLARRRTGDRPPLPPVPRPGGVRVRLLGLPALLCGAAAVLSVVAAAGPCRRTAGAEDRRMARDIVLALDVSESMRGLDLQLDGRPADRMEVLRRHADAFLARRSGDRVGLIAFGNRAVTQCPLTFDREIARALLGHLRPEVLGKRTALGEAIALAAARMPRGGALVLLTDGCNTAGEVTPGDAALAAAARGVRIYALGVGSDGPVPIPARMPSGRVRMEMKPYALDEAELEAVARRTGGLYVRASDAGAIERAFAQVDALERHETPAPRRVPMGRLGRAVAVAAAAAVAAALALSATVLRVYPRLS